MPSNGDDEISFKHTSSFERMKFIESRLRDPQFSANINCLMDALTSIVHDRCTCSLSPIYGHQRPRLQQINTPVAWTSSSSNSKCLATTGAECIGGDCYYKNSHQEKYWQRVKDAVILLNNCRMNTQDFTFINFIGKGAFGKVHLVRHKESDQLYAMKVLRKSTMIRKANSALFWAEREIMAFANSEWIVKLHHAFQDFDHLYMLMDFVPGGDLVTIMSNHDLTESDVKFYVAEVIMAVEAVHSLGYVHRDIKPDNMLIDVDGHIKLADFGTAAQVSIHDGLVDCIVAVGTPDYISPEILHSQSTSLPYGLETDWWSVGVLAYELLVGETPFYAESLVGTYSKIMNHEKYLKFPDSLIISDNAKHLVKSFLQDRSTRLGKNGIKEIKGHAFFQDSSWTWDNIRSTQPPVLPKLSCPEDTSYFEECGGSDDIAQDSEYSIDGECSFEKKCGGKRDTALNTHGDGESDLCLYCAFVGFSYSCDQTPFANLDVEPNTALDNVDHDKTICNEEDDIDDRFNGSTITDKRNDFEYSYRQKHKKYFEKCELCEELTKEIDELKHVIEALADCEKKDLSTDPLTLSLSEDIKGMSPERKESAAVKSEKHLLPIFEPLVSCNSLDPVSMHFSVAANNNSIEDDMDTLYRSQIKSLTCELNGALERNKKLQSELDVNRREIVYMKSVIRAHSKLDEQRTVVSSRLRESHRREASLLADLADARTKYEELADEYERMNRQLNSLSEAHKKSLAEFDALRKEKSQLEEKVEHLVQECNERDMSNNKVQNELSDLKRRYEEQRLMKAETVKKLDQLLRNPEEIVKISGHVLNGSYCKGDSNEKRWIGACGRAGNALLGRSSERSDSTSKGHVEHTSPIASAMSSYIKQNRGHRLEQKCKQLEQSLRNERLVWNKERQNLIKEVERQRTNALCYQRENSDFEENSFSHRSMMFKQKKKPANLNPKCSLSLTVGSSAQTTVSSDPLSVLLEAWLHLPSKHNIKRNGWKKQYCVLFKQSVAFYSSEKDFFTNGTPTKTIYMNNLYHVRAVKQCDVIRVDSSLIPRIFQLIYDTTCALTKSERSYVSSGFGEANKDDRHSVVSKYSNHNNDEDDCAVSINSLGEGNLDCIEYRHHSFMTVSYRIPTTCDVCGKSCFNFFSPPAAIECTRCHLRSHKCHLSDEKATIGFCELKNSKQSAKVLLVLCNTASQQNTWIATIRAQIEARKQVQGGMA